MLAICQSFYLFLSFYLSDTEPFLFQSIDRSVFCSREFLVLMATGWMGAFMVGRDVADGARRCPWAMHFFRAWSDSSAASVVWLISGSPAVKALRCSWASSLYIWAGFTTVQGFVSPFICHTHILPLKHTLSGGYWSSGSGCTLLLMVWYPS